MTASASPMTLQFDVALGIQSGVKKMESIGGVCQLAR